MPLQRISGDTDNISSGLAGISGIGYNVAHVKVRDILTMLNEDGWIELKGKRTSHRQFKHPTKSGKVTVAGKPGDDLAPKTEQSILKQAGLK